MSRDDFSTLDPVRARTRSALEPPKPVAIEALGLTILCHPDPRRVGEWRLLSDLLDKGDVELSRNQLAFSPIEKSRQRPLEDLFLSRAPIRITKAPNDAVVIDTSAVPTTFEVDGKPVHGAQEISARDLERGVVLHLANRVLLALRKTGLAAPETHDGPMVGESYVMARLREEIAQVADLEHLAVLLRGESGTGKELVAHEIHAKSQRHEKPFEAVNMAAMPHNLAASELFGSTRGAFTGAVKKIGLFQKARGGTIFLDEIGDASLETQAALLRVLETHEVQRVGSGTPEKVDVRVIAATDANLEAAIEAGRFREPLYHRLSPAIIELPPLRDRVEDFGRLFFHFLRRELRRFEEEWRLQPAGPEGRPWVSSSIVDHLVRCHWTGNVRQLKNVVSQLAVASRGREEMLWDSRIIGRLETSTSLTGGNTPSAKTRQCSEKPKYRNRRDIDDEELVDALRSTLYNVSHAAERLNVSRTTLNHLIDECPLVWRAKDLNRQEIERALAQFPKDLAKAAEHLKVSEKGLVQRMKELGIS